MRKRRIIEKIKLAAKTYLTGGIVRDPWFADGNDDFALVQVEKEGNGFAQTILLLFYKNKSRICFQEIFNTGKIEIEYHDLFRVWSVEVYNDKFVSKIGFANEPNQTIAKNIPELLAA